MHVAETGCVKRIFSNLNFYRCSARSFCIYHILRIVTENTMSEVRLKLRQVASNLLRVTSVSVLFSATYHDGGVLFCLHTNLTREPCSAFELQRLLWVARYVSCKAPPSPTAELISRLRKTGFNILEVRVASVTKHMLFQQLVFLRLVLGFNPGLLT